MKKPFKPGAVLSPLPVVMVTCGTMEKDMNIITIAWTGIINSDPPMTYVSVRRERHSNEIMRQNMEFTINLTTTDLTFQTDFCGVRSGRDMDKFKAQNLTPVEGVKVSCPSIGESPMNLECKVTKIVELPSHDMFIGEIVNMNVDEKYIGPDGRIRMDLMDLIAYNHGEYFKVSSRPLGRFGYSVMKPSTKKKLAGRNRTSPSRRINKKK